MRLKSELYKKEQDDITDKIISILELENIHIYTLYELDQNEEIQTHLTT
jgi:L-rhamnose mutarotase